MSRGKKNCNNCGHVSRGFYCKTCNNKKRDKQGRIIVGNVIHFNRKIHKVRAYDYTYTLCGVIWNFPNASNRWKDVDCKNCLKFKREEN